VVLEEDRDVITTTTTNLLWTDRTPPPICITKDGFQGVETEYTDEQFYADLKNASKHLDAMVEEAIRDEREGRTREFP
jgi:hypothetical protein